MKKIILGLLLCSSVTVFAQKGPNGHKKRFEKIKTELNLTEAQANELRALHEEYHPKMREVRKDESLSQEAKVEKLAEIRKEKNNKMKSFLSDEQISKLDKIKKQHKGRHGHLKDDLNLSAQQEKQLKAIKQKYKPEFEKVRSNETLPETAKKQQLKKIKKEMRAEMDKVFTEEQKSILKEKRKGHKH